MIRQTQGWVGEDSFLFDEIAIYDEEDRREVLKNKETFVNVKISIEFLLVLAEFPRLGRLILTTGPITENFRDLSDVCKNIKCLHRSKQKDKPYCRNIKHREDVIKQSMHAKRIHPVTEKIPLIHFINPQHMNYQI